MQTWESMDVCWTSYHEQQCYSYEPQRTYIPGNFLCAVCREQQSNGNRSRSLEDGCPPPSSIPILLQASLPLNTPHTLCVAGRAAVICVWQERLSSPPQPQVTCSLPRARTDDEPRCSLCGPGVGSGYKLHMDPNHACDCT